jgi:hypothetical protein
MEATTELLQAGVLLESGYAVGSIAAGVSVFSDCGGSRDGLGISGAVVGGNDPGGLGLGLGVPHPPAQHLHRGIRQNSISA